MTNLSNDEKIERLVQQPVTEEMKRTFARWIGAQGGEATKRKLGPDHFKRISALGVEARKNKKA